eukprot:COSAG02_NODE_6625_length_3452_cov_19.679392_1_plen_190_part_00
MSTLSNTITSGSCSPGSMKSSLCQIRNRGTSRPKMYTPPHTCIRRRYCIPVPSQQATSPFAQNQALPSFKSASSQGKGDGEWATIRCVDLPFISCRANIQVWTLWVESCTSNGNPDTFELGCRCPVSDSICPNISRTNCRRRSSCTADSKWARWIVIMVPPMTRLDTTNSGGAGVDVASAGSASRMRTK